MLSPFELYLIIVEKRPSDRWRKLINLTDKMNLPPGDFYLNAWSIFIEVNRSNHARISLKHFKTFIAGIHMPSSNSKQKNFRSSWGFTLLTVLHLKY